MYYAVVGFLMFGLPLLSMIADAMLSSPQSAMFVIGKWYVFWAVGVRLLLAGFRQVVQPRYTAQVILGLKSDESLLLVRELGFANLAMGLSGLLSLIFPAWRVPVALAAGVFYGLAGGNHALQPHRNRLENVAMLTDLFACAVLLVYFATELLI